MVWGDGLIHLLPHSFDGGTVDTNTKEMLRAAEEAVANLIAGCRKGDALHARCRREVAQVSRTAKWLLNAVKALRTALASTEGQKQG
jgi:hypothetical protein